MPRLVAAGEHRLAVGKERRRLVTFDPAPIELARFPSADGIEHELLRRLRHDRQRPFSVGRQVSGHSLAQPDDRRTVGAAQANRVVDADAAALLGEEDCLPVCRKLGPVGEVEPRQVSLGGLPGQENWHCL
jgi:hypothetical protein